MNLVGLGFVCFSAFLLLILSLIKRKSPPKLRNIPAMTRLYRAVGLSVEDGTRLLIGLGGASLLTQYGGAPLAGLRLLRHLTERTSLSDRPPIAAAGEPSLALLAQDTLRTAHESVAVDQEFDMKNGRLTGLTPLSYAAGVMPSIRDENISTNVLIGNFGPEVGLLVEAANRQNALVIAASDSLPAQAVLFAASDEPLIGEELFAAGAYVQAGATHAASLVVQDILRWLIIVALVAGAALKLVGIL